MKVSFSDCLNPYIVLIAISAATGLLSVCTVFLDLLIDFRDSGPPEVAAKLFMKTSLVFLLLFLPALTSIAISITIIWRGIFRQGSGGSAIKSIALTTVSLTAIVPLLFYIEAK